MGILAEASGPYWLPGDDELSRYEEEGYLISPQIIPLHLLDHAWAAIRRFLDSGGSVLDPLARLSDLRRRDGAAMDHIGYLYHELEEVRTLLSVTPIGAAAGRLARTSSIRLFHDRLLVKPPGGSGESSIGWHVDRAYWLSCTSDSMLTAWIPFVDMDERMGPLRVVPGSHRWDAVPLMATAHRTDMDRLWEEASTGWTGDARSLVMRKGQVSFHNCRLLHGSFPNRGETERGALAVHLQPKDNRRRRVLQPNGRELGHTNDALCRLDEAGQPDYSDPTVFPTLWSADQP
jgi:hypothetical protein